MTIADFVREIQERGTSVLAQIPTQHHFGAGVYLRETHLAKNMAVVSHAHKYDHLSVLASGTVLVSTDTEENTYTAPAVIEIKAGVMHKVVALAPSVWFCVHATDETDAEKVDRVLVQ
jgi:quercetin dioxygenase-like cupin family protein